MLRRLRHLRNLSISELLIFGQLVLFAATVRLSLRYLPLQRLLDILSSAATNRFLRQFPLLHVWSVIPGEQCETRNPGAFGRKPEDGTSNVRHAHEQRSIVKPEGRNAVVRHSRAGENPGATSFESPLSRPERARACPVLDTGVRVKNNASCSVISAQAGIQSSSVRHAHEQKLIHLTNLTNLAARAVRRDGPCLLRSLMIFWLLKARGEHAELLIGVNKENEALQAHAWIEIQGTTIGDSVAMTESFATLARF